MARTKQLAPHGTRARYVNHLNPCHCTACRAANAEYERNRYRRSRGK